MNRLATLAAVVAAFMAGLLMSSAAAQDTTPVCPPCPVCPEPVVCPAVVPVVPTTEALQRAMDAIKAAEQAEKK